MIPLSVGIDKQTKLLRKVIIKSQDSTSFIGCTPNTSILPNYIYMTHIKNTILYL